MIEDAAYEGWLNYLAAAKSQIVERHYLFTGKNEKVTGGESLTGRHSPISALVIIFKWHSPL